jgi:glycosyltransferase involved in cell wall biosynthesis
MGLPISIIQEIKSRHIPYLITLHDFWYVCANAQLLTNYSQEICDGPDKFFNCAQCTLARANQPLFPPAYPLLALPLARRNHLLQNAIAGAVQIITPSHFVKNWYIAQGIPATIIEAIPLGIELPPDLVKEEREGTRPFRVGYIGGLSWQKGVHILIQAFTQLPDPCQLWIAGDLTFDPSYVSELQQQANDNITFLGKLDRDAIWQMLTQVDIVVVPSLWYETFCFVISEANAMGVPVIASNLGVLAERVRDGEDGYLFPTGDSAALSTILANLQKDPPQHIRLRKNIAPVPTLVDHINTITAVYKQHLNDQ